MQPVTTNELELVTGGGKSKGGSTTPNFNILDGNKIQFAVVVAPQLNLVVFGNGNKQSNGVVSGQLI